MNQQMFQFLCVVTMRGHQALTHVKCFSFFVLLLNEHLSITPLEGKVLVSLCCYVHFFLYMCKVVQFQFLCVVTGKPYTIKPRLLRFSFFVLLQIWEENPKGKWKFQFLCVVTFVKFSDNFFVKVLVSLCCYISDATSV